MAIKTSTFSVITKGQGDFINITDRVSEAVKSSEASEGLCHVFVRHTTVALIITEWEEGIKKDILRALKEVAPLDLDYEHHKRGIDTNGSAHVRSVFFGIDCVVPVKNGELLLGTWQQVILIDFDEQPRTREIVVTIMQ